MKELCRNFQRGRLFLFFFFFLIVNCSCSILIAKSIITLCIQIIWISVCLFVVYVSVVLMEKGVDFFINYQINSSVNLMPLEDRPIHINNPIKTLLDLGLLLPLPLTSSKRIILLVLDHKTPPSQMGPPNQTNSRFLLFPYACFQIGIWEFMSWMLTLN